MLGSGKLGYGISRHGGRVELRLGRLGSGTARRLWCVMVRYGAARQGGAVEVC